MNECIPNTDTVFNNICTVYNIYPGIPSVPMKSDAGISECWFAGHFVIAVAILSALTTARVRHPQFASTISPTLKPLFLLSKTLEPGKYVR